jgi:hypothetical protein
MPGGCPGQDRRSCCNRRPLLAVAGQACRGEPARVREHAQGQIRGLGCHITNEDGYVVAESEHVGPGNGNDVVNHGHRMRG